MQAYDINGDGPCYYGLVGSILKFNAAIAVSGWDGCPLPRLKAAGLHSKYRVVEVREVRQRLFVKCELLQASSHAAAHGAPPPPQQQSLGWLPVSESDAKLKSAAECRAAWRAMQQLHVGRPFNGTFAAPKGARAICGQPVRVSALTPPPVFKKGPYQEATAQPAQPAQPAPGTPRPRLPADEPNTRSPKEAAGAGFPSVEDACRGYPAAELGTGAPDGLLLGSNPLVCATKGVCFLPSWAMHALQLRDGDEAVVWALPLPLNQAGRAMVGDCCCGRL
jgi:hypothetical protein